MPERCVFQNDPMRLIPAQTRVVLHCVREQLGADASVMLFGSRLDDDACGGEHQFSGAIHPQCSLGEPLRNTPCD